MARDVRPSLRPSRRHVLGLLASAAFLPGRAPAQEAPIRDQGIGGTGARPTDTPGEGDRGIGGTGVIGTIRRFGSIVVNDLRIAYPDDVAVRIDGAPARASDLRVGHVVRVVARSEGTGLARSRRSAATASRCWASASRRAARSALGRESPGPSASASR